MIKSIVLFGSPLYAWILFEIMLFITCTKLVIFPCRVLFALTFICVLSVIKAFFNSCFIKISTLFTSSSTVNETFWSSESVTACSLTVVIISDIYSVYDLIFETQLLISEAMSWWSYGVTSGSSIEESYSFIKSFNPSAAPDIDIIGVFKLCAIPPINCPRDAKRSLSIRRFWLDWMVSISITCCVTSLNTIRKPIIVCAFSADFTGCISISKNFLTLELLICQLRLVKFPVFSAYSIAFINPE